MASAITLGAQGERPGPRTDQDSTRDSGGLPPVSTWRVLARLAVTVSLLLAFGALRLAEAVGLRRLALRLTGRPYEPLTGPVATRRLFERLGPTYVKLGQLVASGEALFPERYSEEFRKLLDRVPPFGFDEVERTLTEELGGPVHARFASIEREPVAAASIAQVHRATLPSGEKVVIKVQRPGIAERAAADVALMRAFARVGARLSVQLERANAVAVIEDFEANLRQELDFGNEAARMEQFNRVMRAMGNASVAAPEVYAALSGPRVLTMERFDGWRLDDTDAVLASPYDAEERLLTGIRAWFQTLICDGFFHGDVHAGNFLLLEDGRVGFLDFGIVGVFDDAQKKNVLEYVLGFQHGDFDKVARAMVAMGTMDDPDAVDLEGFATDLAEAYEPMMRPTDDFRLGDLVPSLLRVSRRHALRMPRDLVLVTKQLVYLDRVTRALGGHEMNVLTDARLANLIMQDMLAAMFA